MFDPNQPPPATVVRKAFIVDGEAHEGLPVIGSELTTDTTDEGYVETDVRLATHCSGCGAVITDEKDLSVCVVCHRVLCPTCSLVKCSRCGRSVCHEDSERFGSAMFCRPHFVVQVIATIFAVLAAVAVVSLLLLALSKSIL